LTFLLKETTLTKINFQDLNKISLSCEKFEDIKEVAVNRKVKTMQNPEKRKRRKYKQWTTRLYIDNRKRKWFIDLNGIFACKTCIQNIVFINVS
jgi:hypothetical protein